MVRFEGYERREKTIAAALSHYGFSSLEECRDLCASKGVDPLTIVKSVQPIAFDNAGWAYVLGCAIAIKAGVKTADEAAVLIF